MTEGTIVAALTGMAFVMVGIFQFLKGYIASTNQDYLKLLSKHEALQAKVAEMEVNNLIWKNRAYIERGKNKNLLLKLRNCNETITASLAKTQPLPELPEELDDTFFPED